MNDLILLHLPRTSGTSLTNALNIENNMHRSAEQLKNIETKFVFTIKRNVYRRLFSLYNYFRVKREHYVEDKLHNKYRICYCNNIDKLYDSYINKEINYSELKYSMVFNNYFTSFAAFIRYLKDYRSINYNLGLYYLYDHIDFISINNVIIAKQIFDFYEPESIKTFFKIKDMPHHNATGSDKIFSKDIFSCEDIKIINELFYKEIEYFKYEL